MHRANSCAGEHRNGRFRNHRHVNRDSIAALCAEFFQRIGKTADAFVQIAISDFQVTRRIITLPDDRNIISLGIQVSIDTVVANVERTVIKPADAYIVFGKGNIFDFRIRPDPVDALPLLAKSGTACVLPGDLEPLARDAETGRERRVMIAKLCKDAGVPVVLQAAETSAYGARSLWYQAAIAVSQGLTRAEALRAVTLEPARVLGVADRVGSITKGKDANVVLWSGDPLDPASHVEHVWVEGQHVYERATDRRLKRLLEGLQLGRADEGDDK